MPFVLEGREECAVFHFLENFDGDASGDVNATERKDLQSEIASFRTVDVSPQIDGFHAHGTSFIEAVLRDFGSGVGVGVSKGWMLYRWVEKFVKSAKAAAGKNQLCLRKLMY